MSQQTRLRVRRVNVESSGHGAERGEILRPALKGQVTGTAMKLLGDLLPIIAFFIVFKAVGGPTGIYAATASAISIAALLVAVQWFRHRRLERQQLVMLAVLVVLGGLTLALRDERYIKWKPTVVSWLMGGAFLVSRWVGQKTLVERMFGGQIIAPTAVWHRLNLAWSLFFGVLGALNLHFAYHWSTEAWVNFKVFGTFGLSLTFAVIQALYLMRYDVATPEQPGE